MVNIEIAGTGSYLPGDPISNEKLASAFGREVIWLSEMLGAQNRHFAVDLNTLERRSNETNASMAAEAARRALQDANTDPSSIDLIVMGTASPDYTFPATALFVQEQLEIPSCCVMELRAGCGGMAQAFMIASHFLAAGTAKKALLIGSDLLSPYIAPVRRNAGEASKDFLVSIAMFGDAAGALVLTSDGTSDGVLDSRSWSLSTGRPAAMVLRGSGGPRVDDERRDPAGDPGGIFQHDYKAILEQGPELSRSVMRWLIDERGYDMNSVRYFFPPQVNQRLIDHMIDYLALPAPKVVSDFPRVGNTVSASIYVALDHMNRTGQLTPGDLLVLLPAEATKWVFGGVVVRWTKGVA